MSNVKTMSKVRVRKTGDEFARGCVLRLALDRRSDILKELQDADLEVERQRRARKRQGDSPLKASPDDHIFRTRALLISNLMSEAGDNVG
ncbi:MAG: hypothetical protein ACYDHY_14980 [Acidiferrobacterales bacterium]